MVYKVAFAVDEGMVWPYDLVASSANQETKLAAYTISPFASARVLPFSRAKMVATDIVNTSYL